MASGAPAIEGSSPRGQAGAPAPLPGEAVQLWRRLRTDRMALASGAFVVLVLLLCFVVEPILVWALGHGPNTIYPYGTSLDLKPAGPWTWIPDTGAVYPPPNAHTPRTLLVLGADGPLGRDELLRLLAGGRVSLEIGIIAAVIALTIGVTLGALAGFYGGAVDAAVSRSTELVMAFPLILLLIAMGQTISNRIDYITVWGLLEPGVLSLACVIGLFTWFYPARIIRSLALTLREREYIEAARMLGASNPRIIRTHVLPHLWAPILVWGSLITASNIVLESALSFLNIGVKLPTASWGNMLSTNFGTLLGFNPGVSQLIRSNWTLVWPTGALLLTALALALFGEGLRAALDPHRDG